MGSVFAINKDGFDGIVARMIRANPGQEKEIRSFVAWVLAAKMKEAEAIEATEVE